MIQKHIATMISAAVVCALGGVGYWQYQARSSKKNTASAQPRKKKAQLVRTEKVGRRTLQHRLRVSGNIVPRKQATVFSLVPGVVRKLEVQEGQTVKKGQILARLDGYKMVLGLQRARAGRTMAKLQLSQARTTYKRMQALHKKGAIPKSQFDQVETAYKGAQLQVKQARTGVWMAGAQLSDALIRAPIDGVVMKRVAEQGDLMSSAQAMKSSPLLVIADLSVVKAEVSVPERDLGRVYPGQPATVTVDAYPDQRFPGKVTKISETVDPVARTATVTVEVKNRALEGADGMRRIRPLKAGMFARVTIVVGQHSDAVMIPADALLGPFEAPFVFVLRQGRAVRQPVTVGIREQSAAQITRGLRGGEQLIVLGHRMVRDGQRARAGTLPALGGEPPATPVDKE